jgi:hypothetical protein
VGRRFLVLTGTKNQGQKSWYCQVKETKLAGRVTGSLSRFIVPLESNDHLIFHGSFKQGGKNWGGIEILMKIPQLIIQIDTHISHPINLPFERKLKILKGCKILRRPGFEAD